MVRFNVLDALGRSVGTLVNEQLDPGRHMVEWSSGRERPPGIYFARCEIGNQIFQRRLVLLR